jgi:predicted ATPase
MRRFILTGAPGAGKTAILRLLERRGHSVVEEAATDVIALASAQGRREPHRSPGFIDDIVGLQQLRQTRADLTPAEVVIFDRSPICTWALAEFLGYPPSEVLREAAERIVRESVYEWQVFFARNQGFVTPTDARRISFEDSLRFERVHEDVYRRFGFDCLAIEPGPVEARAAAVEAGMRR